MRHLGATSAARDRGGYFIYQNSGLPTDNAAMDTLDETAGLCTLCHGTDVDNLKFYTGSSLWRADTVNGHSNSTLGGSRANRADLFSAARYGLGMGMQARAGQSFGVPSPGAPPDALCGYTAIL